MAVRDWALAIDFGTSNTAAAHTSPISGAVEALTLSHNRTTMSSSVFVAAMSLRSAFPARGAILIGQRTRAIDDCE